MFRETRILMDTSCTITVVSSSEKKAGQAIDAGFARIKELEQLLNYFSSTSEISAINKAAGNNSVKASRETLEVVKKAVEIADYTHGAFDPTIGPLSKLWGFSGQNPRPAVPLENDIKNAMGLIDYKKIKINTSTSEIFLEEKGMELDLGGIAKGYAADIAIEAIKSKGVKAALVAIAGDIKGFGFKPNRQTWKVGIQNPRPESGVSPSRPDASGRGRGGQGDEEDIFATFYLKDKTISTSGDYQRFFIKDGIRYHHILDPKTGYPASGVMSVSVIAPEGFITDGLSTGVFVLGPDKGIKLLESMGLDGIIIDADKKIFITKNLKGKINLEGELKNSVK
jgi:thiamine biosynthesis lipoprotein